MGRGKMTAPHCDWFEGRFTWSAVGRTDPGPSKSIASSYSTEEKVYTYYGGQLAMTMATCEGHVQGNVSYTDESMMAARSQVAGHINEVSPTEYTFRGNAGSGREVGRDGVQEYQIMQLRSSPQPREGKR